MISFSINKSLLSFLENKVLNITPKMMTSLGESKVMGAGQGGEGGTNRVLVAVAGCCCCFTQLPKTQFLPTSMNSLKCA